MRHSTFWTSAAAMLLAAGCVGEMGTPEPNGGGPSPSPGGSGSAGASNAGPGNAGPGNPSPGGAGAGAGMVTVRPPDSPTGCTADSYKAPLQMLNQFELRNAIKDLLGPVTTEVLMPRGARGDYRGALLVDQLPRRWQDTAWGIATEAGRNAAGLTGCPTANQTDACARAFIGKFAAKAYRRPLAAAEIDSLFALYANGKAEGFASGIEMVVAAVLQDPSFLHRIEVGIPNSVKDQPGLRRLTGAEVAQRLSFSLWGTIPDDALTAAAQSGGLDAPAGIRTQAERMLKDPRATAMFADFVEQWLLTEHLGENPKDAGKFPAFAAAVPLLREELNLFVRDLVQNGGDLKALFTADYGFLNGRLASFYKVPGVTSTAPVKTKMPPNAQRSGLLTFAGLLSIEGMDQGVSLAKSNRTFPIGRARFIRERLACEDLPSPLPNATNLPGIKELIDAQNARFGGAEKVPPRAFYQEVTAREAACKACHGYLEPLGFIFERFGADGLVRTNDIDGMPAIQGGRYAELGKNAELVGDYDSPAALATAMSKSASVRDCFTENLVQYAVGQSTDVRPGCFGPTTPTGDASGTRLLDMYLDLVASDPFRIRAVD